MYFFHVKYFIILSILVVCVMASCRPDTDKIQDFKDDFQPKPFIKDYLSSYFNPKDTSFLKLVRNGKDLEIKVFFSDCGEWGGHMEKLILESTVDNKIKVRYIVDSVSCENDIRSNGIYGGIDNTITKIVVDTVKILNTHDERIINLFLNRVFELYIENHCHQFEKYDNPQAHFYIYVDAGYGISIQSTDSSFQMHYGNFDSEENTYYGAVKHLIFPEFINKTNHREKKKDSSITKTFNDLRKLYAFLQRIWDE